MRFKRPIYRYLFYTAWIVVLGGVITLLVAANGKAKTRSCKGVVVSINNGGERIYVEKEDVLKNMEKAVHGSIINRHTGDINLALLERSLEANPWIKDAQLYFDTKDILHVAVSERIPVARIFTADGASFYMDSAGYRLPLLESYSAKLPVVTGYVAVTKMRAADSVRLQQVKEVVQNISADAFWNAQVGQIDITPDGKFELIPVLGSHVIRLGSGSDVKEKLAKLMVFYKQVLPKAGFAKYSVLDAQFNGQVVAVKRGLVSKVDSLQLHKNIEELMKKKLAEQEPDDAMPAATNVSVISNGDFEPEPDRKDTITGTPVSEKSTTPETVAPVKTSIPVKAAATDEKSTPKKTTQQATKPAVKQKAATKPVVQQPKAVMERTAENEY